MIEERSAAIAAFERLPLTEGIGVLSTVMWCDGDPDRSEASLGIRAPRRPKQDIHRSEPSKLFVIVLYPFQPSRDGIATALSFSF